MTPEEAIDVLQEKISPCVAGKWKEAVDVAISALEKQDSETRKNCDTCKHNPPSKKWPCVDCDMREPADRWEPNECQTCKHYDDASEKCGECLELGIDNYEPNEMENSTESSETQNALDTISRQAAIDAILAVTGNSSVRELYEHVQEHGLLDMWSGGVNAAIDIIIAVPSAQPNDWMERNKERILQAGMEGREIEFRIGGRLFAIREKAQ